MSVLLAIVGMTGNAQASDLAVRLDCQVQGQMAQALCEAVRDQLAQRGHSLTDTATTRLTLHASAPSPRRLLARLDVIRDGVRLDGEQGELSVIDREEIPQGQIDSFAADLLDASRLGSR